jgi:hypothetical protein
MAISLRPFVCGQSYIEMMVQLVHLLTLFIIGLTSWMYLVVGIVEIA